MVWHPTSNSREDHPYIKCGLSIYMKAYFDLTRNRNQQLKNSFCMRSVLANDCNINYIDWIEYCRLIFYANDLICYVSIGQFWCNSLHRLGENCVLYTRGSSSPRPRLSDGCYCLIVIASMCLLVCMSSDVTVFTLLMTFWSYVTSYSTPGSWWRPCELVKIFKKRNASCSK